ncbi:WD40 repeat-like protein [Sistotremastrum niveocremeum HHB9708]|uniref:Protein LST8 homolog n=2 Tax=Sistotremastraceae TaxID=3402574 RepID=A0A165AJV0_9AGAM|nr:WD40 repeat-like protein [Sistotremastrum niveocremeum HHB9708]KZT43988.1 WD40 repeat-like protein [Sistotremastrum suecicum HHB10207 ss-3]
MPSSQEVLLVTGSYDHEIRFWEAWSGICSRTLPHPGESGQVNRIAISPDKRFLAVAIHKKVHIFDIASPLTTPIMLFEGHTHNVTSVSFHSEGKWLVTGSEDGTIRIWDLRTNSLHRTYDNGAPVNDVCIHPNQGELISCDQAGSIKQWDLSENTCTFELAPGGDVPIRSVSVSSDGFCLVAGNHRGKCYVWKINDEGSQLPRFQAVTKFQAHDRYLTRVLISPDIKYLATCSADTTIKIWSISPNYTFKLDKVLRGHQRWVWDAAFSADSAYLVTASSDHVARLWEMASGETVRQYNGHHKAAVCCALHDGAGY